MIEILIIMDHVVNRVSGKGDIAQNLKGNFKLNWLYVPGRRHLIDRMAFNYSSDI